MAKIRWSKVYRFGKDHKYDDQDYVVGYQSELGNIEVYTTWTGRRRYKYGNEWFWRISDAKHFAETI